MSKFDRNRIKKTAEKHSAQSNRRRLRK